jgi:hypothetical protein
MRNMDDFTFQALEQRTIEGTACNPVYVTGVGEDYRIMFLDATSNQLVMVQQPGQSPVTGAPVTQKVFIDEYQEAGGLVTPRKLRITYDDELFGTGTVESFVPDAKVDAALFSK